MGTLLLIEPNMSGHHTVHLRWCIREAAERGYRVILGTTTSAVEHDAFKQLDNDLAGAFEVTCPPPARPGSSTTAPSGLSGLWRTQRQYYDFARDVFEKARPVDFIFLPYVDGCCYSLSLLGIPFRGTPWAGIVMRPSFHFRKTEVIAPAPSLAPAKEWLFLRLLRSRGLQTLLTLDETLVEYVTRKSSRYAGKLTFLPDPVDVQPVISREQGRLALDLPADATIVLNFGSVTARKGVKTLLRSMLEPDWPSHAHVFLAGKQDPDIAEYIRSEDVRRIRDRGQLHVLDRFLTDDESAAAFAASDFVWCGYEKHYQMSGVLVLAGLWGRPVIACREGLVGSLTKRHGTGVVLPDLEPHSIARVVATLASDQSAARRFGDAGQRVYHGYTFANAASLVGALWP